MTLSVCMIARNEEEYLERCLQSIRGIADEIIFVDTGSTDRTPEIARRFGAKVFEFPWTGNFAEARNVSLRQATGDWILSLDADEELAPADVAKLKALLAGADAEAYILNQVSYLGKEPGAEVEIVPRVLLFRNRPEYRFTGAIHEQVTESIQASRPDARFAPSGVSILHYGYLDHRVRRKDRRNIEILLRELDKAPGDCYLRFQLGSEYLRQGAYRQAMAQFTRARKGLDIRAMWASRLWLLMGSCLIQQRDYSRAVRVLDEGIGIYKDFTDLYFLKALALFEDGDHSRAALTIGQCLALGPAPSPPYITNSGYCGYRANLLAGQIYEHLGLMADAAGHYSRAFASNRSFLPPLYRLGQILGSRESTGNVCGYLEGLMDLKNPLQMAILADVLLQAGLQSAAEHYAERALLFDPNLAEAHLIRGLCRVASGRITEGLADLALVPDSHSLADKARQSSYLARWFTGSAGAIPPNQDHSPDGYIELAGVFTRQAAYWLGQARKRFPQSEILARLVRSLPGGAEPWASG